jgi:hypothetical protein
MWLRFTADMDWSPRPGVTIAYKAGWTGNVPTLAGDAAVKVGRAVRLRKVRKGEEAVEVPPTDVGGTDGGGG